MRRNKFGINIDEGVALSTPEEFDHLYIESEPEVNNQLKRWLSHGNKPVLVGGQIGCGKTSFIEYSFYKHKIKPDITFHFDSESLNLSLIDSWSILFAELFRYISIHQLTEIEEIPETIKAILGKDSDEWIISISKIRMETFSSDSIEKNKAFNQQLENIQTSLPKLFKSIMLRLEDTKSMPLFIFASGLDKFQPGTTAWFSLGEILQSLSHYKTLYELNAVHLFLHEQWMHSIEKIVISASKSDWIKIILEKRLGTYSSGYEKEIQLIAQFSGGIPRQALRLLDSFLAEKKLQKSNPEAFVQAVKNINRDFFSFGVRPDSILLQTIAKDNFIETTLISLPGDKETAQNAVFGNWIILYFPENESRWKASINPIIKKSFALSQVEEPETKLLNEYARQQGISEYGLDLNVEISGWQNIFNDNIEASIELNITEILELISSALLSKQRTDRVIIAYEDKDIANVVRAYLTAKSNSYEYQVWQHTDLLIKHDLSILLQIIQSCNQQNIDVFSFDFDKNISDEQLAELNIKRDGFLNKQMIWWIPKAKLNVYLSKWTQLRQLFQVYVLEEELQRYLSIQDIESDLDFMNDLVEHEGSNSYSYVKNLELVLQYLKVAKDG